MSELRALQQRFLSYLQRADRAISADVTGGDDNSNARRLSIYYNAYRMRLRGSIDTDHPVLGVYLGDDLFDKLVLAYINAHPSAQTSLRHFCDQLPKFLEREAPFSDTPVLADLARFERLLMDVFDAADGARLAADYLQSLSADQWPTLTLQFHPSVRCVVTPWNTVDIWRAIKAERAPPAARQGPNQAWLLWRNRERLTEFRSASVDEYNALLQALNGAGFADVCELLLEWHTEAEVAERALSLLSEWLTQGLLVHDGQENLS